MEIKIKATRLELKMLSLAYLEGIFSSRSSDCSVDGDDEKEDHEEVKKKIDERDLSTPDNWISRCKCLTRLTGHHPFNAEPSLGLIMTDFLTPTQYHYVRNHGSVPKLSWEGHKIRLKDVFGYTVLSLTMDDLVAMPSVTLPVTLTCAGNRRKEQNLVKKSLGFDWGAGAVSTSRWTGVYLKGILEKYGMVPKCLDRFLPKQYYVLFTGCDELPRGSYGTSMKLEDVLDPSREVILAYQQNGTNLTPDHGFPVRVIIPGYIGGRMVKWLGEIQISDTESQSYYHFFDNRVLPSCYDEFSIETAPEMWKNPDFVIYDRNINSVITSPDHNETLIIGKGHVTHQFEGYAYAGAGKKVIRVELSLDGGKRWVPADIDCQERCSRYGKYWCWVRWTAEVEINLLVASRNVFVRAWDQTMNSQPRSECWNVMGMMNNTWYGVRVNVGWLGRGLVLEFVHPADISALNGWMSKGPADTVRQVHSAGQLCSANDAQKRRKITREELVSHASEDSCWIQIDEKIYDVTKWLPRHPGGTTSIVNEAGQDCTESFHRIHSSLAQRMLKKWQIGEST